MNAATFVSMLAEWQQRSGYTTRQAAAVLGCGAGTLRHWLGGRTVPGYFSMCAVVRQMRDGHDSLTDVLMTRTEFAETLKAWRIKHGFSQRQAAVAIGTMTDTVRRWESLNTVPCQPGLGEILRRLRMPVDAELVKQATRTPRPVEPEKFAGLLRAWRRRRKLSRAEAAEELRSAGQRTTGRTIWIWETAREYPRRPLVILDLIHGPLAVNPPTPRKPRSRALITPRKFATLLREWRRKYCLTQMQACAALGLKRDPAVISDWERGRHFPQKSRLLSVVAALQVPPSTGPGTHNWYKARSDGFGKKLREWRKARGLRQVDACAALGLPRDQGLICLYERGEASPRHERMTRLLAIIEGTEVKP
jgi:transcriptional regulator with XRE-family HTH domain